MGDIIIRDLKLAWRNKFSWWQGPFFFILFITLCVLALNPGGTLQTEIAGPLIWIGVLFSLFLNFTSLFQTDFQDGTLEALQLSGVGNLNIVSAKAVTFFLTSFLPFLVILPIAGLIMSLSTGLISAIGISLLVSAPALIAYGVLSGALLGRMNSASFLVILVIAPLVIPVLIFGTAAINSYMMEGLRAVEFKALLGINLIALAIGLPAAAAALKANLE